MLLGALGLNALRQGDVCGAALGPVVFFSVQLSAVAYPGARELEAEFPALVLRLGPIRLNEAPIALAMLGLAARLCSGRHVVEQPHRAEPRGGDQPARRCLDLA
ncbi:hypothetical protein JMJ56_19175 [Belnapia sp. T18]|uniref:Uncharacterized protein n=1 Tax=Belnapia arida TaxID=2804533 RepID=A0ABS1U666_9PROT|nr:hypothetical protein [Belnapia arida]MBL6080143.1 hypothetical protein [Belnapia arida]